MSGNANDGLLEEWLNVNMPSGTIIGDPKWWAKKIRNVLGYENANLAKPQPQPTSQYSKYALAWQPIATAPKDKRILVFTGQEIYAANWVKNIENDQEAWRVGYMTNGDGLVVSALLWHDAPDAP